MFLENWKNQLEFPNMDQFHVLSKKSEDLVFLQLEFPSQGWNSALEAEHVEVKNIEPMFWWLLMPLKNIPDLLYLVPLVYVHV